MHIISSLPNWKHEKLKSIRESGPLVRQGLLSVCKILRLPALDTGMLPATPYSPVPPVAATKPVAFTVFSLSSWMQMSLCHPITDTIAGLVCVCVSKSYTHTYIYTCIIMPLSTDKVISKFFFYGLQCMVLIFVYVIEKVSQAN